MSTTRVRNISIAVISGFVVGVAAASAYLLAGGSYFLFIPRWASIVFFPGFWAGNWAANHCGLSIGACKVIGVTAVGLAYAAIAVLAHWCCLAIRKIKFNVSPRP